MVILILEKVPKSLRGLISRLTIEPKANVFVGKMNARVRDKLWGNICNKWDVTALMIYTTNTEQGYRILLNGEPSREVLDFDGLQLIATNIETK